MAQRPPSDGSFLEWFKSQQAKQQPVVVLAPTTTNRPQAAQALLESDSDDEKEKEQTQSAASKSQPQPAGVEGAGKPAASTGTSTSTVPGTVPSTGAGASTDGDIDKVAAYVAQKGPGVLGGLAGQYSFLESSHPQHHVYATRLAHYQQLQIAFEAAKAKAAAAAAALTAQHKRPLGWVENPVTDVGVGVGLEAPRKKQRQRGGGDDSDEEREKAAALHRKRAEEMAMTEAQARVLTEAAAGKHHLADYLPKEELEKFMRKAQAVRNKTSGSDIDESDYQQHKITSNNIGYKLLAKTGWKEGQGLGAQGQGITAPVGRGQTAAEGLGTEKPEEVKEDDDDFELYRKRMMLAYRYRPNPFNNPRRPY